MGKRTIGLINRELNYLEAAYQRLNIKTVEYREEKKKLQKEKDKILNLSDAELVKLEKNKTKQNKSLLENRLSDPNGGKDKPQETIILGDTDYLNK